MSMINDALKRAQKTRPSNAPGPQLRAAEPSQFANRSLLLVVPALLVFAVLIGAFFLWQAFQNPARNPEPVRAKTIAPANPEPVKPEPVKPKTVAVQNPQPQVVPPLVQKVVQPPTQKIAQRPVQIAMASAPKPKPTTPKPASVAAPAPTSQKTSVSATPATAPAPVVAPPPTPVKLQAIFYSPGRSTAMINGKTVAVGDALKEYRITTITPTSVRIISFTQTNVLTLPPQ